MNNKNINQVDNGFNQIGSGFNQTGGGFISVIGKVFAALLIITVVIVIIVFGISFVLLKLLRNNPLTKGLTSILCIFASNAYITLISGVLELLISVVPPAAAIVIPLLKVLDSYSLACSLFSSESIPILDTVLGVISLLPVAGSLGKFAKFYRKW